MTIAITLIAALVTGYALGRVRPLHRARSWAWWRIQTYGRRHASTLQTLLALALWPSIALKAFRAWRQDKPPTSRLASAPKLNEKWQAKLDDRPR
ncbi:hypothetical protein ACBJ59_12230 [Nonomuraea sp. MTCD27]|uniref:hypothetical protein n=1 Tax=Nonomuraea sp. MTCD27 TaxID=1676747 RepID=UPI0035BEC132